MTPARCYRCGSSATDPIVLGDTLTCCDRNLVLAWVRSSPAVLTAAAELEAEAIGEATCGPSPWYEYRRLAALDALWSAAARAVAP